LDIFGLNNTTKEAMAASGPADLVLFKKSFMIFFENIEN